MLSCGLMLSHAMQSAPAKVDNDAAAADFVKQASPVIAYWSMFCLFFFLNINSSFWSDFVTQLKTVSCFTVGGMQWSNALCLVFFLLPLNHLTIDNMLSLIDWFGLMLIIDERRWSKWGVQKFNFVKFCFLTRWWFNGSVYYYYS